MMTPFINKQLVMGLAMNPYKIVYIFISLKSMLMNVVKSYIGVWVEIHLVLSQFHTIFGFPLASKKTKNNLMTLICSSYMKASCILANQ